MARKESEPAKKMEFHCPYCDEEVQQAKLPWCQACGVKLLYCEKCGQPIAKGEAVCPHCGAKFSVK
jgi:DNA-directed RNA polymerase subunit RPC12/RpoP